MIHTRALAALVLTLAVLVTGAADKVTRTPVTFPDGATDTTLTGTITGYDSVEYMVPAGVGQEMAVTLSSSNAGLYFNVFAPGAVPGEATALFNGARSGPSFKAVLDAEGEYMVQVFLVRAAARRAERADYSVTVALTGAAVPAAAAPAPAAGDFADGLAGGPDHWQVTEGGVSMRAVPGVGGSVAGTLAADDVVRNLGCRMVAGERWCQVEATDAGKVRGWVTGKVLRESVVPPPGDGAASGALPCAWRSAQTSESCRYEADASGSGNAVVSITRPDGQRRQITFQAGRAAATNLGDDVRLATTRRGSTTLVTAGAERYEIPDVAIWGK